jgi:hypothetical protein
MADILGASFIFYNWFYTIDKGINKTTETNEQYVQKKEPVCQMKSNLKFSFVWLNGV